MVLATSRAMAAPSNRAVASAAALLPAAHPAAVTWRTDSLRASCADTARRRQTRLLAISKRTQIPVALGLSGCCWYREDSSRPVEKARHRDDDGDDADADADNKKENEVKKRGGGQSAPYVYKVPRKIWNFEDVLSKVKSDKDDGVVLVDVRERAEVLESALIPGAINIPLSALMWSMGVSDAQFKATYGFKRPSREMTLVFYCKAGVRAQTAARLSKMKGWLNADEYTGSWQEWLWKKGPIEKVDAGSGKKEVDSLRKEVSSLGKEEVDGSEKEKANDLGKEP